MPNRKNELVQLCTGWRDREPLGLQHIATVSNGDANDPVVDAVPMVGRNNNVDRSVVPTADGEPIVDAVPIMRNDFVSDGVEIRENAIPSSAI